MDVGSVFSRTWVLYKRNFGWLLLAGIIAAAIVYVINLLTGAIAGAIAASASSNLAFVDGQISFNFDSSVEGAIIGVFAVVIGGALVSQLLALMLEGGMIKMGITSYRSGCSAQLSGLFDGFRHAGSFALFWLVTVAVAFGVFGLVFLVGWSAGRIAILLGIVGFVFLVWILILWVYVIALITDHGLSCGEALSRSKEMVKRTGWWKTFLPLFVLGILFFVIMMVVGIAGFGVGGRSRIVLQVIAEILLMPYSVCFLASMYVGAEALGSPVTGGGAQASPPSPPAKPRPLDPAAERAAWTAAADPLAQASVMLVTPPTSSGQPPTLTPAPVSPSFIESAPSVAPPSPPPSFVEPPAVMPPAPPGAGTPAGGLEEHVW
jgi:hypothetical protein